MKIYVAYAYRGPAGDEATSEEIEQNCQRAEQLFMSLVRRFPSVHWYSPHLDSKLHNLNDLWLNAGDRHPLTRMIMQKCKENVDTCDALIAIDYISDGVQEEIDHCTETYKPHLCVDWDGDWEENIAQFIMEIKDDRAEAV